MKTDHRNTRLSKNNRGFTLLEAVIAMAIFSIGILAVGSMQLWNTKNNTTGNLTTQATMLARQKIEELKTVTDITALASDSDAIGIYTREWNVPNPHGNSTSRQLTVIVSWNRRGQNRSVVLESFTFGEEVDDAPSASSSFCTSSVKRICREYDTPDKSPVPCSSHIQNAP